MWVWGEENVRGKAKRYNFFKREKKKKERYKVTAGIGSDNKKFCMNTDKKDKLYTKKRKTIPFDLLFIYYFIFLLGNFIRSQIK